MNRLVLVGNGFDLAHGLPTKYEDFINWYWDQRFRGFRKTHSSISRDILCEFEIEGPHLWDQYYRILAKNQVSNGKEFIDSIIHNNVRKDGVKTSCSCSFSPFFGNIIKSIETKGWVDIENEYYDQLKKCTVDGSLDKKALEELNSQLSYITDLLINYLKTLSKKKLVKKKAILDIIYSPIRQFDVSIEGDHLVEEYVKDRLNDDNYISQKIMFYDLNEPVCRKKIEQVKEYFEKRGFISFIPQLFMLPDILLILNFNYTDTVDSYLQQNLIGYAIHIHGELNDRDSIIFGYGDELDEKYKQLQALNENECLKNIKSIKYLESENYRTVLSFLEDNPYQVFIMGHSCGNSDRTLLNTIFEHKNCISIKPYYYIKEDGSDSYLDIVQNISRNFTDMKLMRDRVVNKAYCEPLPQAKPKRAKR